jgi:chemotaxis protein histidine kinase CheA
MVRASTPGTRGFSLEKRISPRENEPSARNRPMNLEPAPRLPKLPFFVADAVLLIAAAALAKFSARPLDTTTLVLIAVLVMIGAGLIIAPFIIAYIADTAEAVQRERERVNDQVARLHAATESLARAAAQIKAVEDAVHKVARDAETLPYRMQEKLAEFNETLAAKEDNDREALETELEELRAASTDQLKHTAEKITKAAADWAALETATRKQLTAAEAALAKLQDGSAHAATQFQAQISTALRELEAKIVDLKHAAASVPTTITVATVPATPAPAVVSAPGPVETPAVSTPASVVHEAPLASPPAAVAPVSDPHGTAPEEEASLAPAAVEAPVPPTPAPAAPDADLKPALPHEPLVTVEPPVSTEPPKPKKPRAPRKPKAEETLLAMSIDTPAASANGTEHAPEPAAPENAPEPEPAPAPAVAPMGSLPSDEPAPESSSTAEVESSTSSDGATRLLVTAYIGIGNKLFIRGDGPGLSWDRGVPMQFVSIGKWGWFTHDATGPVRCKLYKNDDLASLTGEVVLETGRHTEVTALF